MIESKTKLKEKAVVWPKDGPKVKDWKCQEKFEP